jgi:hypothetical protein
MAWNLWMTVRVGEEESGATLGSAALQPAE